MLAILLVAIVGLATWQVVVPREPAYEGKPLSAWLEDLRYPGDDVRRSKAQEALFAIGTNALPHLRQMLRARDYLPLSWLRSLNRMGQPHFHIRTSVEMRSRAISAYSTLGAMASPDVPILASVVREETTPGVRAGAAWALGCIRPRGVQAAVAIPALVSGARAEESDVKFLCLQALALINHSKPKAPAELVLPVFIESLNHTNAGTRALAWMEVRNYGNEAIPALWAARETNQVAADILRELGKPPWGMRLRPSSPANTRAGICL